MYVVHLLAIARAIPLLEVHNPPSSRVSESLSPVSPFFLPLSCSVYGSCVENCAYYLNIKVSSRMRVNAVQKAVLGQPKTPVPLQRLGRTSLLVPFAFSLFSELSLPPLPSRFSLLTGLR